MKVNVLTQKRLKEVLHYNPDTGIFVWIVGHKGHFKNRVAGNKMHDYLRIGIDGKDYLAHRLAWFYVHGVWPTGEIDHKDTIKTHNWITNLRDVSVTVNQQNRIKAQCNNKVGLLGVSIHKATGKYDSRIRVLGKVKWLGLFSTAEQAHAAYLKAKRELHSGCTI